MRDSVSIFGWRRTQEDFGVWKYWSELKEQYLTFEFVHGMGLGIVFVGTEPVGEISKLFSMSEESDYPISEFLFRFWFKSIYYRRKRRAIARFLCRAGVTEYWKRTSSAVTRSTGSQKEQI